MKPSLLENYEFFAWKPKMYNRLTNAWTLENYIKYKNSQLSTSPFSLDSLYRRHVEIWSNKASYTIHPYFKRDNNSVYRSRRQNYQAQPKLTMGQVFADLFYPDNPKRRTQVVQLTQNMYDFMQANFRATNKLTDFLNENVEEASFAHIAVDENKSLKDNSNLLIGRIEAAQAIIEKIDNELAEKLDPGLYRVLTNVDLSFQDRMDTAQKATHVVTGVVITVAAIAVCVAIASGGILAPVVAVLGALATSAIATTIISVIGGLGIGMIVGAITGAIERDQLNDAISQLEAQLKNFGPASQKYTESIYEVLAELRIHELQ